MHIPHFHEVEYYQMLISQYFNFSAQELPNSNFWLISQNRKSLEMDQTEEILFEDIPSHLEGYT